MIWGLVRWPRVPTVPCALSAWQGRFCAASPNRGHGWKEENERFNRYSIAAGFGKVWGGGLLEGQVTELTDAGFHFSRENPDLAQQGLSRV